MSFVWPNLPELDVADFDLGQLAMSSDSDSDTDDEMPALEEKFEYLSEYDSGQRLFWIPAPVDERRIDKSKWLIVHPTANLREPVAEAPRGSSSDDDNTNYLVEVPSVPNFVTAIYLEEMEKRYERNLQEIRDAMAWTEERSALLALADGTATPLHLEILENLQLAVSKRKAARSDLLASKDA